MGNRTTIPRMLRRQRWGGQPRRTALSQTALPQFIAEDLLRIRREVVDLVDKIADFDVADFAVERSEVTPFFHGVLLHGEEYSGCYWWWSSRIRRHPRSQRRDMGHPGIQLNLNQAKKEKRAIGAPRTIVRGAQACRARNDRISIGDEFRSSGRCSSRYRRAWHGLQRER